MKTPCSIFWQSRKVWIICLRDFFVFLSAPISLILKWAEVGWKRHLKDEPSELSIKFLLIWSQIFGLFGWTVLFETKFSGTLIHFKLLIHSRILSSNMSHTQMQIFPDNHINLDSSHVFSCWHRFRKHFHCPLQLWLNIYERTGSWGLSSKPNPLGWTRHDNLQWWHDWTGHGKSRCGFLLTVPYGTLSPINATHS